MCVIIYKPAKKDILLENLKKCWIANPHGAGVMFASNNTFLRIIKGLMTFENFLRVYNENNLIEKEVVIHFRLASSGEISPGLTHPFWVFPDGEMKHDLAFVHNGHLCDYDTGGISQSDTTVFRDKILAKLPHNFLQNDAIVELLDSYLNNSIIVFMDNLSNINILGDTNSSLTLNNVWYSNGYWQSEDCISESTLNDEEKEELYTMELYDVRDRLETEDMHEQYLRTLNNEYVQLDMFPEV
jgi:predicted glutamine amidotransferase